ncbi:unnamed protein product [Allacma fusca]|uniref:Uncharacterized protein n=1 Tax=Allacma fusca TaxID=39272 RepID=A0A8J2LAD4_9HEXA|nr:unnamed protein product [Allacma fusca]
MAHNSYCQYFYLYVYSVGIFLHVNPVVTKPLSSFPSSQYYGNGNREASYDENILTTEESLTTEVNMTFETSTLPSDEDLSSSPVPEAEQPHSNKTAILVGILFAMTMIVKGVPVIIAYSIRWCSKSPEEDKTENGKEEEGKTESGLKKEIEKPIDCKILEVPLDLKQPAPSIEEKKEKRSEKDSFEEIDLRDTFICKQIDRAI